MPRNEDYQLPREDIVAFQNQVELAEPGDIIEGPPSFIKRWQPKGLPECGYFTYKGVLVCAAGNIEKVQKFLDRTQEELMQHGTGGINMHGQNKVKSAPQASEDEVQETYSGFHSD